MSGRGTRAEGTGQVLRNAAYLLSAYVLPRVFTVASVVVAARWLGTDRFGVYGAAAALAVLTSVVSSAGMMPLLVREIARAPERAGALLAGAARIKVVTSLAMVLLTWVASGIVLGDQPEARAAAMVMTVGWVAHSFAENLAAYFQAVERMARWTQASALYGIVSAVVGVTLLLVTGSVAAYCAGFAVGWGAAWAWLSLGLPAAARGAATAGPEMRLLVRDLLPFAAAFVALTLYCKIDVLLLQRWSTQTEVGLYTAAYKFVDVFQALVTVAAGAAYPRLSRSRADGPGRPKGGRAATEVLLLGAVPVGMLLHLTAGLVVPLLFGADYARAVQALGRLSLLMPMLAVTVLGGYVLGAAGRMVSAAALYAAGLALNVALNAVLVPASGAAGAALARLGSEAALLIGFLVVLRGVGAAPRPRVVAAAGLALAAGALLRLLPDPTGGILHGAAFVVALAALYGLARVVDVAEVVAAVRRAAPARRAEVV